VLTADHGEEFLDHGMVWHESIHLYQELTRVPLVMALPESDQVTRVETPVMQIDVGPTLLDLAGIPTPDVMQGRSIAPLVRGETLPPRAAFSEGLDWGHVAAVWNEPRKLIFDREASRLEVYDFRSDPSERQDLLIDDPGARGALLDSLTHYDARNRERAGRLVRSSGTLSAEQMEKLRSLGYIQ
jgi:arylsulfatase A-like enzyme